MKTKILFFLGFFANLTLSNAQISLLKDISVGSSSSFPEKFIELNGSLIFTAETSNFGQELWITDGTEEETRMLKDINPGTASGGAIGYYAILDDKLIFPFYDSQNGTELWSTDGTESGTNLIKDIKSGTESSEPNQLFHFNNKIYFTARAVGEGISGPELWYTNGTSAGTHMMKDFYVPGQGTVSITNFITYNNKFYFNVQRGWIQEFYVSDGTTAGTQLVSNHPATNNAVVFNDYIYFTAYQEGHGIELLQSDGTSGSATLVKDIFSGSGNSNPSGLIEVNGKLFFNANDGVHGNELWVTDGTESGTYLVKDIFSGSNSSINSGGIRFNDQLIFSANDGVHGTEMWISDGTESGTKLVKDINLGFNSNSLINNNSFVFNNRIYFHSTDGTHGYELWMSDGTEEGTLMIEDLYSGSGNSNPGNLKEFNGKIYFSANAQGLGREIFYFNSLPFTHTYIPDDNFEQALIDLGYDDLLDDYVLTENISGVTSLNVQGKNINNLTGIEGFTALTNLNCSNNNLSELDVSSNTALTTLAFNYNFLTALDVSSNINLKSLNCAYNHITELDLNSNINLTHLHCYNNELTNLDLSANVDLVDLNCSNNMISELNLNTNVDLRNLVCSSNYLTALDLNANPFLVSLQCNYNQINTLDLSSNPDLMYLYCYSNALTELNVKNGNNANLTLFAAHYNYNLTCIQVDDADAIPSNWVKDSQAVYSEYCYVIWTLENEWSNVVGPTINDNVIIEGDLVLEDDLAAKNLTIAESGSLTIPGDKTLTLSMRISNEYNSEQFIIENGGNLIQNGTATNSGNITVHRESDPMIRLDYTLWSSPVVGQNLFGFSPETVNGVTNYEGSPGRIYVYDGTNGYVNPNPFLETTEMNSGAGYLFRAPNNYSSTVPANYDGVFTGQPYNGNLSVTTAANNYTSVGNPYPSNIDADLFLAVNPDITSLYLWLNNHSPGNNYASCTSGNCVAAAGGGNQPNGVIAVGQGFIVATTNTSVNFTNSMRTADATDFFRPSTTEKHRFWINLLDDENVGFNQILVGYMEGATMGIDQQIDGKMFGYEGSALYNIIDNDAFVIQGRSLPFADSDVVPLGFRATENGKFKIELDNFDGLFAEGQAIYVKDNLLGIQHKLTNSAYEFESEAGTFKDRFEIVYVEEGIMGIDDLTANGILIYKNQNLIEISSKESPIDSVEIFDLSGRKLFSESGINSPIFQVDSKQFETQVLIVKVKTENGKMKTKKWMNK